MYRYTLQKYRRRAITTDPDTGEPVVDTTQIYLQAP